MDIKGVSITTQAALTYLGIVLDARFFFREHLVYTCEKVSKLCRALTRMILISMDQNKEIHEWRRWGVGSRKGRWTFRVIPNIDRLLKRLHGEVAFYLTRILTGHGCFKSYLKRSQHKNDDICDNCGDETIQNLEHTYSIVPNTTRRDDTSKVHSV